jgi:predicted RND superfamily exporter protein
MARENRVMFARNYLNFLVNIKYLVLMVVAFSTLFFIMNIDSQSISNDEKEWIRGSEDHQKLVNNNQVELLGKKIIVSLDIDVIDEKSFIELQKIHKYLLSLTSSNNINSIFNHQISRKLDDGEGSSFVELTNIYDDKDGFKLFEIHKKEFFQYFSNNGLNFYLFSKDEINIDKIETTLQYRVENLFGEEKLIEESILLLGFGFVLAILLFLFFKSLSAPIIGLTFVVITSTATLYFFKLFVGDYTPHISILILSFSISFMDYLYIYYRWFVLQQKRDSFHSMNRTIERTFAPIFFTTIVNIFGIGSLIFVDSTILQSLGFMVIISSIIGLVYSFLFLPIIFLFLDVKNPHTTSEGFASEFSEKIKNYNRKTLFIFIFLTISFLLFTLFKLQTGSYHVASEYSSKIIKLSLDYDEITIESMEELEKISEILNIDEVEKIVSPYQTIKALYEKEEGQKSFSLNNVDLDRYIFLLEMFGNYDDLFKNGKTKLDIYLYKNEDKGRVINIIKDNNLDIFITDVDTLLQSAKIETINTMVFLVILIIIVISLVILIMTRMFLYSLIGIMVTLVPLVWFFSGITILDLPLSTEMFVAMIVAVAISSDATIHLIHYYHKLDSESRFDKDGVQKLFLYVESPLILGNLILAITFFLMIVANISSIMFIGIFSAVIVLLSLTTDIFILPVVILESRKHRK